MSLTKIHDIYPTPFTTRHDVALTWNGTLLQLAWTHYDRDRDADGDLLTSYWNYNPQQKPQWTAPVALADDASTGPGLAGGYSTPLGSGIVIAYGNREGKLRVVWFNPGILDEFVLDDATYDRPTLAWSPGRLWLAWTGTDHSLNTMFAKHHLDFGNKATYRGEHSENSPGLSSDDIHVGLAWSGTEEQHWLHIAHITDDGGLTDKLTLNEKDGCNTGPSLCTREGRFYAGWGTTREQRIAMFEDLWRRPDYELDDQRTQHAPGMAYPYIAWADEDYRIQLGSFD